MKHAQHLTINFAPQRTATWLAGTPLWSWPIAMIGLILLIGSVIGAFKIADKKQAVQIGLERKSSALRADAQRQKQVKPVTIPEAQAIAVNLAILQLNLPWSELFDALEAATPDNIALIEIDPDAKKGVVHGEAEASNSDAMIAYIEQLKKQPQFVDVVLTKHEVNLQDTFRPIRFQFEAQWKEGL